MTTALRELNDHLSRRPADEWGKQLYGQVQEDELTTRAAAFAYHWAFAIPPLLLVTVLVGSLLDRVAGVPVVENLRDLVRDRAPADAQAVLNRLIDGAVAEVGGGPASVGALFAALLALWAGSNGVGALMDALNRVHGVEKDRPFVRKKAVAIGLTLLLALFVNLAFALLVFGRAIGEWVAERIGVGGAFDIVWGLLRWPIALGAIVVLLALLYRFGPNVERPLHWVTPGSVVATLLWMAAILGVGLYLRFANPGSAYGVLGGVIVLLFFLYVTGVAFMLGAEVDALLEGRSAPAMDRPAKQEGMRAVRHGRLRRQPEAP